MPTALPELRLDLSRDPLRPIAIVKAEFPDVHLYRMEDLLFLLMDGLRDLHDLTGRHLAEVNLTGKSGGAGLFCRATGSGRYEFYIQPDGKWSIRRNAIAHYYLPRLKDLTRRQFAGSALFPLLVTGRTTTGQPSLEALFENPPVRFSPVPTWWWSGEKLERGRLRYEMERTAEGGLRNVCVIHLAPAAPFVHTFADAPPFFSDEWWRLFRSVCQDARELGMRVWFYDQIGFSSANIRVTCCAPNRVSAGAG